MIRLTEPICFPRAKARMIIRVVATSRLALSARNERLRIEALNLLDALRPYIHEQFG